MRHGEKLERDDPSNVKANRQPQGAAAQASPCERKAHRQHRDEFGEDENPAGEMGKDAAKQREARKPMRGIKHAPPQRRLDKMQHRKQQRSADAGSKRPRIAKPQSQQQPTKEPFLNQGHAHGRNQHLRQHAAEDHRFVIGRKIPHRLQQRGKSPQHANRNEASGQGLDQRCFPRQLLP